MAANEVRIVVTGDDKASGVVQGIGGKITGALKLPAIGAAAAVAGLGASALTMAADFEKGMSEVRTLLPQIGDQAFGALEQGVLGFSKEMGIATKDAIPALYQAISAGVPPDNVIDFMKTAAKASIGGVTDLETAVDGITSVVNAYGSEVVSAGKASDVMFTAVRMGKTNFAQLSDSLFQVIPTAASLGVSFEEVSAALATMTAQGVPTSVATTQLRQAFVEASKSGTKLDDAIKKVSGDSFSNLIKRGSTAQEVFRELRGAMPEQEFKDLFGSVEAMNAVLQITGPNAEKFASNLTEMRTSAGSTDVAFQTMSKTFDFQLKKALNLLKVTLMEIGIQVLPYVTRALEKLNPWLERNLPVAIEKVKEAWRDVQPDVEKFVETLREDVIPVIQDVIAFIEEHWPQIRAVIVSELRQIQNHLRLAFDIIGGIFKVFHGLFTGDWEEMWEGVKQIALAPWNFIQSEISRHLELIKGLFGFDLEEAMKKPFVVLGGAVSFVFEGMKGIATGAINHVIGLLNSFLGGLDRISGFANALLPGNPVPGVPRIPTIGANGETEWAPGVISNMLTRHTGGIVPGPLGQDVPILAQGGEMVLTRQQQQGMSGVTQNYYITADPGWSTEQMQKLARIIREEANAGLRLSSLQGVWQGSGLFA